MEDTVEPVAIEPVAIEPVAIEPVAIEPVAEVPVAEVPVAEVPVAEVPVAIEPVAEVPVAEVPVAEVPVAEVPVAEVPVAVEFSLLQPENSSEKFFVEMNNAQYDYCSLIPFLTESKYIVMGTHQEQVTAYAENYYRDTGKVFSPY